MASFKRTAQATWTGEFTKGKGHLAVGSGAFSGPYSFNSRFADEKATNPEELIGAAHAGCFTMALSVALTHAGKPPQKLTTDAIVTIEKQGDGFAISLIELHLEAEVPGITEDEFTKLAEEAKVNCPVSKALAGTKIQLISKLHPSQA